MRVALVHDYLNQYGGGERVLEILTEIFPEAPIYTLLYDEKRTRGKFTGRKIIVSFLNKIPGAKKHHRWFFPLMPAAVESWDFSNFDLVISTSASFAKGIKVKPPTKHFSYLFTPTRFLWDEAESRLREEMPAVFRPLARLMIKKLRRWDFQAAQRPDVLIPNSEHIKRQIEKTYHRSAENVIYPPAIIDDSAIINDSGLLKNEYFVIVSRLIPYKRIGIAIQACEALGVNLKIIGAGRDEQRLKRLAKKHTEFLGEIGDKEKNLYLANAKAFLMPQKEDFGIAPVEALACGTPVIAYAAGGATEIVEPYENGLFFAKQTSGDLSDAILKFEKLKFDRRAVASSVERFSKENFKKEFLNRVQELYRSFQKETSL